MEDEYWNLFWMTGMPSAWVLSHGRSEVSSPRDGTAAEGPSGPPDNPPGGPEGYH